MKQGFSILVFGLSVLACVPAALAQQAEGRRLKADQLSIDDGAGKVIVQKAASPTGISSVTVERMAARTGCHSKKGAGRIAGDGPLEIYHMQCEDGRIFMARCELRQCSPMR